jgi:hypothetical protein
MAKNNTRPKHVRLSFEETKALKNRISKKEISDADVDILLNLIALTAWIQDKLSSTELTIKKLMKFFGFKSEKGQKQSCEPADTDGDNNKTDDLSVLETESPDKELDKEKMVE